MRRPLIVLLFSGSLLLVTPSPGLPQGAPRQVKHVPTCSTCRIELSRVLSFGSRTDPVLVRPSGAVRDSRGRYFAIGGNRYHVVAFDASGRYLAAIGGRGQGPGEFGTGLGASQVTVGRGDSLFVFLSEGRVLVFSPQLTFARSVPLPPSSRRQAQPLSDGTFVVAAAIRTPAAIGFPYHVLRPDGTLLRSFGDPKVHLLMDDPRYALRQDMPGAPFVVSPDGKSIWLSPRYRIRQYDVTASAPGVAFDVIDAPWLAFPTWEVPTMSRGRAGSMTQGGGSISLAGVDAEGLLWINAMGITRVGRGTRTQRAIEVFDPKVGALLVSEATDLYLRFVTADLAYTTAEDTDGIITYTIWRVRLRRS